MKERIEEIRDEYDEAVRRMLPLSRGHTRIGAATTMAKFNERFGAHLPRGGVQTAGGPAAHRLGKLPKQGDAIQFASFRFVVETSREARLTALRVDAPRSAEHKRVEAPRLPARRRGPPAGLLCRVRACPRRGLCPLGPGGPAPP